MNRALFLDRDGTLVNGQRGFYPRQPSDLVLSEGVGAALRVAQAAGWCLIVATNQAGVAYGYIDREELDALHQHLAMLLAGEGVRLNAIYDCTHHPDAGCTCRKPQPGMLLRAAQEHTVDLSASWMIGDFATDVQAGQAAGCHTALVGTDTCTPTLVRPTAASAIWAVLAQAWATHTGSVRAAERRVRWMS